MISSRVDFATYLEKSRNGRNPRTSVKFDLEEDDFLMILSSLINIGFFKICVLPYQMFVF
jgi:hypothetical protein